MRSQIALKTMTFQANKPVSNQNTSILDFPLIHISKQTKFSSEQLKDVLMNL